MPKKTLKNISEIRRYFPEVDAELPKMARGGSWKSG